MNQRALLEKFETLINQAQETQSMPKVFQAGLLPAGTYYVGDLCYAISDDEWGAFVSRSFPDPQTMVEGIFETPEGISYAEFGTQFGDGTYSDTVGRVYPVDSGSIGCIPAHALAPEFDREGLSQVGNFIEFNEAFEVGCDDETGTIRFGDVEIMTGDIEVIE